jgi:hypothetical protein
MNPSHPLHVSVGCGAEPIMTSESILPLRLIEIVIVQAMSNHLSKSFHASNSPSNNGLITFGTSFHSDMHGKSHANHAPAWYR